MSKKTAHFLFFLDKSGSMMGVKDTTIKGVDDFITSIAEASKENGIDSTISVITFDDRVDVEKHLMHRDPATFGSIGAHYHIRGGTSIYDALGVGLSGFEAEGNVVVALFTDGGEYNSKTYNQESVGALIKEKQKAGWTVAYVSPAYDCEHFAGNINIASGNVLKYESGTTGTRTAFSKLGRAAERYLANLGKGVKNDKKSFFGDLEKYAAMKVKKMQVVINMPRALKSKKKGDDEEKQALPPYAPVDAYVVDEYPGCPDTWMHGSSKASSYFVPVKEGRGMWLDFNGCDKEYDVAAVVSVQGINPITGQKSDTLKLERYENKCPKHNCDFQQDRYCPECEYKWPAQNYLATTGTPENEFWLDGFRDEDGKIRQYIFTEEQARGVANAIIGDDKVYAIGIAFYKSKKKKPVQPVLAAGGYECLSRGMAMPALRSFATYNLSKGMTKSAYVSPQGMDSPRFTCSVGPRGAAMSSVPEAALMPMAASFDGDGGGVAMMDVDSACIGASDVMLETKYEVGAGAAIDQQLHEDKESLDYWESEPTGFVYINYADQRKVDQILAQGKRKEKKGGFLAAVPVGN
jgi:hypothetical protein